MSLVQTPITSELRRVLEFVNTLSFDPPWDMLGALDEARGWLAASGLPGDLAGEPERERLVALRDAIRSVLEANAGHGDREAGWAALEPFAAVAPLYIRPGVDPSLAPAGSGLSATIATILATAYDAVRAGTFGRLKLCRESSCRWAYYDESKNGSGTWCSMRVCGNRNKARRRRERSRPTS
jgi:predicted RNA-binding Zn ribbon-like protein